MTDDFKIGQRVQLSPHLDWWMRGARFGTVTKRGKKYITVRLDSYPRPVAIPRAGLSPIGKEGE